MNGRSIPPIFLFTRVICAAILLATMSPACARADGLDLPEVFDWSDNRIDYHWGPNFREPSVSDSKGNGQDVQKHVVTFAHLDGYAWGSNLLIVDYLLSDRHDPAEHSTDGAYEVYGVYRHDFGYSKIFGTGDPLSPLVKEVSLQWGADANVKNTAFGSQKLMPVAGVGIVWNLPFLFKTSLLWDKEWNRNGISHKSVNYDSTARFESVWAVPFPLWNRALQFEGFAVINAPKGRDGFGAQTKTEYLVHPKLMVDVGRDLFDQAKRLYLGLGYEHWNNKFGVDHTTNAGAEANAVFIEASIHF